MEMKEKKGIIMNRDCNSAREPTHGSVGAGGRGRGEGANEDECEA